MRPDGTRVKDLPPLVAAIPYIMPKRYDAWNSVTENIDEEIIKDFIRTHRRAGVRLNHMSVIISAYYKAVLRNPKLNYFVMNGRIYRRNHFCVSFVILKKQANGVVNETTLKVYLDENDTVFTVNQKIADAIARQSGGAPVQQHRQVRQVHVLRAGSAEIRRVAGLSSGPPRSAAPEDHRAVPLPHQHVHHESGLHQDQLYPPPLL